MIQEIVKYSRIVKARKIHQSVNQAALEITDWEAKIDSYSASTSAVTLRCINKKDKLPTSNLSMEIPKEDIPLVIDALRKFI